MWRSYCLWLEGQHSSKRIIQSLRVWKIHLDRFTSEIISLKIENYFIAWGEWTKCDKSCQNSAGKRKRFRKCKNVCSNVIEDDNKCRPFINSLQNRTYTNTDYTRCTPCPAYGRPNLLSKHMPFIISISSLKSFHSGLNGVSGQRWEGIHFVDTVCGKNVTFWSWMFNICILLGYWREERSRTCVKAKNKELK